MEESDGEKDSEGKPSTLKASPSVSGLDEYEFKDEEEDEEEEEEEEEDDIDEDEDEDEDDEEEEEEEEEDLALNDRHHYRRDLRQREKEERNHMSAKPSTKTDPPPSSSSSSKSKKQKSTVRVLPCSTDSSSDEMDGLAAAPVERRGSPSCSQSTADAFKAEPARAKKDGEQKDKGKVKRKSKGQNKNKENQEDGKENSKGLVFSAAAVAESAEKGRADEDSFKMSFSPKDDSSVHLFHLSSVKSPKLNHGLLSDKAPTPLKQENAKTSAPAADGPADTVKYIHYTDAVDYCTTEGSSTKGCKHKEKSKHQQREPPAAADGDDGSRSPSKDGSLGNGAECPDTAAVAARKMDADGKVVKKHKLKHKEKEKHRRDYEVDRSRHRQKEARKDGHRNLEFDREFWKENFFKSDEADEPPAPPPVKREGEGDGCPPQKARDGSPVKEERPVKDKHSGRQEKRSRDEKEKSVKKERKEDKGKDGKWSEREERADGHGSGRFPAEPPQQSSMGTEVEERAVSLNPAEQEPPEQPSEKGARDRGDKRPPAKDREAERADKRHPEKKVKAEQSDRAEPQTSVERWKEKEKSAASSSHSPGDKSHKERENEKLRSASSTTKKHEESRKNKERNSEKRSDRDRPERDYNGGEHREKDRPGVDKKSKPMEKPSEHSKPDRSKEKDCDRKKKDKLKDGSFSSGSNLKSLLEEKRSYSSESSKSASLKQKEEVARTPEKERDRRERDPDRHRDKDRHRERSQTTKLNRVKPSDTDADRVKSKASPASRDARPKEKRLVNDDLMQTSFERMLSLKDQEIEQWHRKHLEKIKQKERERLKQRPSADPSKPKSKDKAAKTDTCLSKELLRSKSSEAGDSQSRERAPKDGTGSRTMSLDGKSLCSLSAKVMASMDTGLSRSPRPDGERSGVMSRSVSMVSVASSEDSCQAAMLTPRPTEYDSDVNPEASDSQPPLLQSSLAVLQATQSPLVHDKDCNSLPEVPHSSWSPLSNRHETPYLRAILDEDANLTSADGKDGADALENAPLPVHSADEPKAAEPGATEPPADPEEGLIDDNTLLQRPGDKAEGKADTEREETRPEYVPVSPASYRDAPDKELFNSESNLSSAYGTPSRATEQRVPSSSDAATATRDLFWPVVNVAAEENAGDNGMALESTTLSYSSALTADTSTATNTQEAAIWPCPQRDLFTATESSQPSEPMEAMNVDHEEKPSETAMNMTAAERAGQDGEGSTWDTCKKDGSASPVPSAFTNIPSFEAEEPASAPSKANAEARWAPEESDVREQLCKKSKTSTTDAAAAAVAFDAAQAEKTEPSTAGSSSPVFYCRTPEHKAEETRIAPQTTELNDDVNNNGGVEARHAYVSRAEEGSSAEVGPAPDTAPERSMEPGPEQTETAPPSEEMQETTSSTTSSSSATGEQSGFRPPAPADCSTSTSGCSSPQSGDSDSSGTKFKQRSQDHDDPDAPVPHPRKRKMPRVSPLQSSAPPPGREPGQQHQSLAAIVDSVKLEEIEPYQTERANPYYEYLHIRKKIEEKRKVLCSVTPQPPQYYDEYVTFNGSYLLDGNPLSKLCIPMVSVNHDGTLAG